MPLDDLQPRLAPRSGDFAARFNRAPAAMVHNLSGTWLFGMEQLLRLAGRYAACPQDYFVAGGAPSPGTVFYAVPHGGLTPERALQQLDRASCRVLMKRPENHDPMFRELLHDLFRQVQDFSGGIAPPIVRLESAVFVSSAATITPFHFDPEIAFFMQVEGQKTYHVYAPQSLSEEELERFYVCGMVNIGQVRLEGRDPALEYVFELGPGAGLHQPQDSPHWVETHGSRSVSYSFVFETAAGRSAARARAFNHYLRKFGRPGAPPGHSPLRDRLKGETMRLAMPIRDGARRALKLLQP